MSHSYRVCHSQKNGEALFKGGVRGFSSVELLFFIREKRPLNKVQIQICRQTITKLPWRLPIRKTECKRWIFPRSGEKQRAARTVHSTDGEGRREFGLSASDPIRSKDGVHPDGSSGEISAIPLSMQPAILYLFGVPWFGCVRLTAKHTGQAAHAECVPIIALGMQKDESGD